MLNGRQVRHNWPTEAEAITDKQNLEREAANMTPLPTITTKLTNEQAKEAEAVFHRLDGQPHGLTTLVDFALQNYQPTDQQISVSNAFSKFIAFKRFEDPRPLTISNLEQRLNRLIEAQGGQLTSAVQPEALKVLIFREGSGNTNRNNDYRAFTNFFNWCVQENYCRLSPMLRVPKVVVDESEPVILPLATARKLVSLTLTFEGGILIPYVVLGLFCGLRPTEIQRIKWEADNLVQKTIIVGKDIAKLRGRRVVEIKDNVLEFLGPHCLNNTPIFPKNWRKSFDQLKLLAGFGTATDENPHLAPWPVDVLRHTAISNHFAAFEHEGKTAMWAGNSPEIIHKHYKGLVSKKDALEFWNIMPDLHTIIVLDQEVA